jgi:hypothetical protein
LADLTFVKIKQPTAREICKTIELGEQAGLLLQNEALPAEFLQLLIDHELYQDAVRFLATALPKREATWWACQCGRHGLGDSPSDANIKAIELAEAWVYKPTDENRLPTMPAAAETEFKTAAGWAAIAAFWSGGNISPVPGATVEPADDLFVKAVVGAVILGAVQGKPDEVQPNYRLFLKKGIDIACGGHGRIA